MQRTVVLGILFVVIAVAASSSFLSWRIPVEPVAQEDRSEPPLERPAVKAVGPAFPRGRPATDFGSDPGRSPREDPRGSAREHRGGDDRYGTLERRVQRLEASLAEEAAERQRLEERLTGAMAQLARLASATEQPVPVPGDAASPAPQAAQEASAAPAADWTKSATERALAAAGLEPDAAEEIKRHGDELALAEVYLRDQATREGWLDSPRFKEEMAAIDAERLPIRDQIGDEAYDRYLFALGRNNRVLVDDVMLQSPAAEVGLQPGDLIVRYDGTRIFDPGELVAETHGGTPGETVRIEVVRNGERLEIDVPRGPLGLRIGATQDHPEQS